MPVWAALVEVEMVIPHKNTHAQSFNCNYELVQHLTFESVKEIALAAPCFISVASSDVWEGKEGGDDGVGAPSFDRFVK